MTLLVTIAFFMAVGGWFIILNLSPFVFLEGIAEYLAPKNTTIKSRIKASKSKKGPKGLKLLFIEVKETLRLTGKVDMFATLCVLSMILFVIGTLMALTMDNFMLVPVLAVGLSLLPFYYIKFTTGKRKIQINAELETALSVVTTSYLRNKNTIIRAIEENLPYLNPPVSEVFSDFLMRTKLINSNIMEALEELKAGIDNAVFHEWIDAVIACQDDYNLKSTLPPIVAKLSDIRVVSSELHLLLFEPVKEYSTMLILLIGSIPLMYFLNQSWHQTLMYTGFGKALLAICGAVVFVSAAAVVKHTRPIEYKR